MNDEQALNATIQNETTETQAQEASTVENKNDVEVKEQVVAQPYKAFNSEDEYNKILQSERSKAKYEILKELGIGNVDEFKNLKSSKDELAKTKDELAKELEEVKRDLQLEKIGVLDTKKKEFLALAGAKNDSADKSLDEIAQQIRIEYPNLFKNEIKQTNDLNIGTAKGSSINKPNGKDPFKGYTFRH